MHSVFLSFYQFLCFPDAIMEVVYGFPLLCASLSVVDNNWLVACHVNYILLKTINLIIIYMIDL